MAEKELLLTLRIKVSDLPDADRETLAKEAGMAPGDVPTVEDTDANEIAYTLSNTLESEGGNDMIWEGSEHYLRITESVVTRAEWAVDARASLPTLAILERPSDCPRGDLCCGLVLSVEGQGKVACCAVAGCKHNHNPTLGGCGVDRIHV